VAALDIVHAMIDKGVSTHSKSSKRDQQTAPGYLRHLEPIHLPSRYLQAALRSCLMALDQNLGDVLSMRNLRGMAPPWLEVIRASENFEVSERSIHPPIS